MVVTIVAVVDVLAPIHVVVVVFTHVIVFTVLDAKDSKWLTCDRKFLEKL